MNLLRICDKWRNPRTGAVAWSKQCPNYNPKYEGSHGGYKYTFASRDEAEDYIRWCNSPEGLEYYLRRNPGKTEADYHPMKSCYECVACGGWHCSTRDGDWTEHNKVQRSKDRNERWLREKGLRGGYNDIDDEYLKHIDEL